MGNLPNKIKNLYYLKKVVSVPEFCEFKVKDFLNDSNKILNKIRKKYKKKLLFDQHVLTKTVKTQMLVNISVFQTLMQVINFN